MPWCWCDSFSHRLRSPKTEACTETTVSVLVQSAHSQQTSRKNKKTQQRNFLVNGKLHGSYECRMCLDADVGKTFAGLLLWVCCHLPQTYLPSWRSDFKGCMGKDTRKLDAGSNTITSNPPLLLLPFLPKDINNFQALEYVWKRGEASQLGSTMAIVRSTRVYIHTLQ